MSSPSSILRKHSGGHDMNSQPLQAVRILVIADIRIYREGLAQLLAREPRFRVVGSAAGQEEAFALLQDTWVDVVLLDMAMAESMVAVRAIVAALPEVKVVALAVPETEDDIVSCAEAGISGYVLRDGSQQDLLATVDTVVRGEILCSPRVAATLLRRVAELAAEHRTELSGASLTTRELEIVRLLDQGLSNKEIARQLSIQLSTTKNHVHNILAKLGTHRRAEAAALVRGGLARSLRSLTPLR
jgi:two-component system nitrate/nitrite response regulator NarL